MFNLKIMLRNLRLGGIYSVINIGGLAIGMAVSILILSVIYHEWSFDRFHKKEKQLYVTYTCPIYDGVVQTMGYTNTVLGPTFKENYPQIVATARMSNTTFVFSNGDVKLKIYTGRTDPDFLTMFDFPLLYGNRETALNDPYSVILTKRTATRLFGTEDPMGKTLLVNNQQSVTVTGVMKDLPSNTEFGFEALIPIDLSKALGQWHDEGWYSISVQTFVELHPNAQLDLVNESIRGIVQAHTDERQAEVFLYPLNRHHLYSRFENGVPVGGLVDMLRVVGIIAGLILLIACINFINISTARSEKRAVEVGVRKVMGGKRLSLIGQFLGESSVVVLIAGAIALILVLLAYPKFGAFINPSIEKRLTS